VVPSRVRAARASRKPKIDVERRAQIGQEKRARTRATVLEVAFSLLGRERGLTTRIDEICEAAGISRGTFYNYFTSMDELFDALSYELNHDFNRAVTAVVGRMPRAADRAGSAIRYYLERARKDPKWAWAMVNISAGGPIFGADTYAHAQRTTEEGIESGEFDLISAESGRDLQLGATLAAMITQLHNPSSPTYPAVVARHVLRGMGVAKKRVEQIISRPLPDPMTGEF
jgi:AcrR family transcriptional regulator